jgi:PAS domain-containing protein
MNLERLNQADSRVVGEVLRAAADGPFFPDWEFQTLFGLERLEVRQIAQAWPLPAVDPQTVIIAVNNSFNTLLGYPHGKDDVWSEWISVDRPTLYELFNRLRGHGNENYFGRMM